MTEITSFPSRPMRWLARVGSAAAWVLGVLLSLWLLLWCVLHFWVVPHIDDFRPRIAALTSHALGTPVEIGHLQAASNGLVPSFDIRDVRVLTPQGDTGLLLPRVLVSLSVRSLVKLGFEQIYIEQPLLRATRNAAGRVSVGGIDLSDGESKTDTSWAADWFFSQPEFIVHQARLEWQDDKIQAPLLSLSDVTLVIRNSARSHQMRLDATPAAGWGAPFVLMGDFKRPLLSLHAGRWQQWRGQAYADFPQVDVSQLRHHVRMNTQVNTGHGALRAWMDVDHGEWQRVSTDLALPEVSLRLKPELEPLTLRDVQGRLGAERVDQGWAVSSRGLKFRTAEGEQWPGGNVDVRWQPAVAHTPAQGEVTAAQLDLKALAQIAERLPLDANAHRLLRETQPQGQVQNLKLTWAGPLDALARYSAAGRIQHLTLQPQAVAPNAAARSTPGRPGVSDADVTVDLTERGGSATLAMNRGALHFPGVFEDPKLAFDRLQASGQWTVQGDAIQIPNIKLQFANADATGNVAIAWHTGEGAARFPGVMALTGTLQRANAASVHRYLPLGINAEVRHYVRDAVQRGELRDVAVRISGPLDDMPSHNPKVGEFRFAGQMRNAHYAYVPRAVHAATAGASSASWPALTALNGEIIFDRLSMRMKGVDARIDGQPQLLAKNVSAEIADFEHSKVVVNGLLSGPLSSMLGMVQHSPLSAMLSHALDEASAKGDAQVQLNLQLPINQIDRSTVNGQLRLQNNELTVHPDAPTLQQAQGTLNFTEQGFTANGVQARALGGPMRLDGGLHPNAAAGSGLPNALHAQGQFQAATLAQWPTVSTLHPLLSQAQGAANYQATLGFQHGVTELNITSNLQGVTLALPEPAGKPRADSTLPLRVQRRALLSAPPGQQDEWRIRWGDAGSVTLQRDISGATSRLLRASAGFGAAEPPLPASGLQTVLRVPRLDVDAWRRSVDAMDAASARANPKGSKTESAVPWPDRMDVQANELVTQGYRLSDLRMQTTREGSLWRSDVNAKELQGQIDVVPGDATSAGRVRARLKRLHLTADAAAQVEQNAASSSAPLSIPALDIEADSFELRGRALGKLNLQAVNSGSATQRQWRLSNLSLTVPEGQLSANGQWVSPPSGGARRTDLDVNLQTTDAGKLLARLGLPDTVRRGHGSLTGRIGWQGSPLSVDTPSMGGHLDVNIENGQFLKADPGAAKLLGVLSLQSLPRRLTLDFRDLFSQGFAFDFVRGHADVQNGIVRTNNLQMKGVNAAVLLEGQANLVNETQDLRVVVAPELNAGTASLVAAVINPAIGIGTFLAQMILRQPLIAAATQEFKIDGSWADPKVTKVVRRPAAATPTVAPFSAN